MDGCPFFHTEKARPASQNNQVAAAAAAASSPPCAATRVAPESQANPPPQATPAPPIAAPVYTRGRYIWSAPTIKIPITTFRRPRLPTYTKATASPPSYSTATGPLALRPTMRIQRNGNNGNNNDTNAPVTSTLTLPAMRRRRRHRRSNTGTGTSSDSTAPFALMYGFDYTQLLHVIAAEHWSLGLWVPRAELGPGVLYSNIVCETWLRWEVGGDGGSDNDGTGTGTGTGDEEVCFSGCIELNKGNVGTTRPAKGETKSERQRRRCWREEGVVEALELGELLALETEGLRVGIEVYWWIR